MAPIIKMIIKIKLSLEQHFLMYTQKFRPTFTSLEAGRNVCICFKMSIKSKFNVYYGLFKCYVMSWGVSFPGKKRYEGVRFNVISLTRGWVGSNSLEKSVT